MTSRKMARMHLLFGRHSGHCKDCPHLIRGEYHDKHYYKCKAYGLSRSEATDWRVGWDACGMIDKEIGQTFRPVLDRIKRESKGQPIQPVEGQMKMEV